jgi:hypothetical protein
MFAVDAVRSGWGGGRVSGCGISPATDAARTDVAAKAPGGTADCRPVDAAPSGVEAALQASLAGLLQALQSVALAGLSAADTLLARLGDAGGAGDAGAGTGAGAAAVAADVSLRERTSLRFVTQQGDVVEIELRARARLGVAAASGATADAAVTAGTGRMVAGASLEIHVRGDLNEAELAAIGDVLGKVEALAQQFQSGDVAAAFAAAGTLQLDGAQIASLALDMRQSMRVRAAMATVAGALPAAARTVPSASAAATGATAAPTVDVAAAPPPAAAEAPTADAATAPTAPPALARAGGFLAGALEQLDAAGAAAIHLGMRQKLQLLLAATAQAAPARDPAVAKLAESVQALD